jgi:hypothetical protein
MRLKIPKTHALDAACVGTVNNITSQHQPTLTIKAMGRGCYQRTRLTAYGFPRGYLTRSKSIEGFQTGDMVKATVLKGKKIGSYTGRVAVRASGNFNIQMTSEVIQGIAHRYCQLIQPNDGYAYSLNNGAITRDSVQVSSKARIAKQSAFTSPALSPAFHAQI